LTEKKPKKGILQRIWSIIKEFVNFLSKRYIWPGLLAGFLWSFSAPFILHALSLAHWNVPQEAVWTLFFPITSSLQVMYGLGLVGPDGYIDILFLWGLSIIVGMIIGVVITYGIHRIRILLKR
jgi:hypothetical protein